VVERSYAEIALEGAGDAPNSARADILARVIDAFQQAAYVIAASRLNVSQNIKFKPGPEFRASFSLDVFPMAPGSLAVPIALREDPDLLAPDLDHRPPVLDDLQAALQAVTSGQLDRLQILIPDSVLRTRFLRETARASPRRGESWRLKYRNRHVDWVRLDASIHDVLDAWIATPELVEQSLTVTGDLIRIDFEEHALWIRYRPNGREIRCSYTFDIEESIVESRNEPIQVSGRFILDDEGHPRNLTDVFRAQPVDLSPIRIERFHTNLGSFHARPGLVIRPQLSEDQQTLEAVFDELALHAYAQTRDELVTEVQTQLAVLWFEFVETEDDLALDGTALAIVMGERITRLR
jgi:hypothetical protein